MAYDVTSLRNAIAQGRVDETEATQLIIEQTEWETKVAKLLDKPAIVPNSQVVVEADKPAETTAA